MSTSANIKGTAVRDLRVRLTLAVAFIVFAMSAAVPCRGQEKPPMSRQKALMMATTGALLGNRELFDAIRARLFGLPLNLEWVEIENLGASPSDPASRARQLAKERGASMVFWVESDEPVRVALYVHGQDGGGINRRTLDIDTDSRLSRLEVIAIAVTSMIEAVLRTPSRTAAPEPVVSPIDESASGVPANQRKRRLEIRLAYNGAFYAKGSVVHGGALGIGFLPIEHLELFASFIQSFPHETQTERFRLRTFSRGVEILAAGIVKTGSLEIRLGLAGSIELCSFSPSSLSEEVDATARGLSIVPVLMPFVSAARLFSEQVGIFALLGASLAINEKDYQIREEDGVTKVLSPFTAKLTWRFGLRVLF